jgi:hypothetical protein
MRSDPRTYPLDLDIGDVADGYHLIVRSISLTGANLVVDWAFVPELDYCQRIIDSGHYVPMSCGALFACPETGGHPSAPGRRNPSVPTGVPVISENGC